MKLIMKVLQDVLICFYFLIPCEKGEVNFTYFYGGFL